MPPVSLPVSAPSIADVIVLRGADCDADTTPMLLVEVPHGADRLADYNALAARLRGPLPANLHHFFHVNTDVGAWQLGERVARDWLAAHPTRAALLVRCLIPRTFIDCNRIPALPGGDLSAGGMTAGIPAYITDDGDIALLIDLHAQYAALAEAAFAAVCDAGGLALVPHSYAPRSVGITSIGLDIVDQLHACYQPDVFSTWPLRAEIDLLTRDAQGVSYAPPGAEALAVASYTRAGYTPVVNGTYHLHPATLGFQWCTRWPGQVLTFEVRRDLIVQSWDPFVEMQADPSRTSALATPLVEVLTALTQSR